MQTAPRSCHGPQASNSLGDSQDDWIKIPNLIAWLMHGARDDDPLSTIESMRQVLIMLGLAYLHEIPVHAKRLEASSPSGAQIGLASLLKGVWQMPGVAGLVLGLVAGSIYFVFRQKQRQEKVVAPHPDDSYFREVIESELQRRQADYVLEKDSVVVRSKADSAMLPILPIQEICYGQSQEKWPSEIQAYFAAALSENPIHFGPLSEILAFKEQLDPFDPRLPLLRYHELREIEKRQWVSDPIDVSRLSPETTQEMKTILASGLSFSSRDTQDFARRIFPGPPDERLELLCQLYKRVNAEERSYIRSLIDPGMGWQLQAFARRSAVFGRRKSEWRHIMNGFIALAIEDLAAGDARDDLVTLALLYHCADAIEVNPVLLMQQITDLASPPIASLFADFIQRDDLHQIHLEMGWREVKGPYGIGYVLALA
ncbi:MAG: hypothetical protein ACK40D_05730 [Cyanobacteriota bacterium]|jgi:hypothetical protein